MSNHVKKLHYPLNQAQHIDDEQGEIAQSLQLMFA